MIRAHAYPVLALLGSLSLIAIAVLQIPTAVRNHRFNRCVDGIEAHLKASNIPLEYRLGNVAIPERICNGGFDH